MLEARAVSLSRQGRLLVESVSLRVAPGELNIVLGPNGAGKSSLLGILAGLYAPSAGEVWMAGRPLRGQSTAELARQRAVVEQNPLTPAGWSTLELIQSGAYLLGDATDACRRAMELSCTEELAQRQARTLSGGEQQRAHLARALCQLLASADAERYLLLDEPTAALDFAMADALLAQVARICRELNIGALAVVHDLNLALRHADNVLLLNEGRAAGFGPTAQIMRRETLEAVYGVRLAELSSQEHALRAFVPLPHPHPD